jgi:hemerythrin-like metal-binding protein
MNNELTPEGRNLPLVLVVDDEIFVKSLVDEALKDVCHVISVEDGPDAHMAIAAAIPDLILLDIELPSGQSGLELCQEIRQNPDLLNIPIMFISAHDEINDRVAGYAAGGDDYVIKPFSLRELRARVVRLLKYAGQRRELENTASFASSTAMTALSSMGEIGVLLESLKKFNATQEFEAIARAMVEAMADYGLQGAVQIRTSQSKLAMSTRGEATPIELDVIERMVGMDRIFQFSNRLVITYQGASMLVSNLPTSDSERVGRLRDHLAMLVEGADVRVQAIETALESKRRGEAIDYTLMRVTEALKEIDVSQRKGRVWTSLVVTEMSDNISRALLNVALTEEQEDYLTSVIHAAIGSILDTHADESNVQDKLSSLINELKIVCGEAGSSLGAPSGFMWSDAYSVGNGVIDEDHKTLIILMNRVADAIAIRNKVRIVLAFSQIVDFSKEHFLREEDMLRRGGLAGLNEYRMNHAKSLKVLALLQQHALDHSDSDMGDIAERLKECILDHILAGKGISGEALPGHIA